MSDCKPQEALKLGVNVFLEQSCGGCKFCEMPYEFTSIIEEDNGLIIEIKDEKTLWSYISRLKKEANELSKNGSDQNIIYNVFEQLPFFCCTNNLVDEDAQYNIKKYIYCDKTKIPAYPGNFGDQPARWIERYFIIENAINQMKYKKNKQSIEKQKSNMNKHGN